jgi:hypothetical protein
VYARPVITSDSEATKQEGSGNLIDALLANEAQRKKEQEVKAQKEAAAVARVRELKGLSIDDLKKRLSKKGLEASGKKEEMIQILFTALMDEESIAERKAALKAKSQVELKEIVSRSGLPAGGKDEMIKSILAFEAKQKEDLKVFESKISELVEQKKASMESESNATLKEMCAQKGLAVGGGKEERIARLAEKLREDPTLDAMVSKDLRSKRKQDLMAMEKKDVISLCEKMDIEPWTKEIMVERIIAHESEGSEAIALPDSAPPAKKARTSKK